MKLAVLLALQWGRGAYASEAAPNGLVEGRRITGFNEAEARTPRKQWEEVDALLAEYALQWGRGAYASEAILDGLN